MHPSTLLIYAVRVANIVSANALAIQREGYTPAQIESQFGYQVATQDAVDDSQHLDWQIQGAEIPVIVTESIDAGSSADIEAISDTFQTDQHQGTTVDSEMVYGGTVDAGAGWLEKDLMERDQYEPEEIQSSNQSMHEPIRDLLPRIGAQDSRLNSTSTKNTLTDVAVHQITGAANPYNAQLEEEDTWCCIVNKGIKFCFECPSATSATEIALVTRAAATMTHGLRSLLPRMEDDPDASEALCCFTTGLVVFGCYLCHKSPPGTEITVESAVYTKA